MGPILKFGGGNTDIGEEPVVEGGRAKFGELPIGHLARRPTCPGDAGYTFK